MYSFTRQSTALVVLLSLLALAVPVFGAEPSGAVVNASDLGAFQGLAAGTVTIQAGNITTATLNSSLSTYRWAGFFGNVSGAIILGDGSGNSFFQWPGANGLIIYASTGTPTWALLADANESNVVSNYTYLNESNDNYTATFTGAEESIGSFIFPSVTSDYATTLSGGATTWKTYSLAAGQEIVFAAYVVDSGTAYDGSIADFQMILPENGTGNDPTATSWNIFVELV